MPFIIKKVDGGYKVSNAYTGRTYSNTPLSKENALKQLKAIYYYWNKPIFNKNYPFIFYD